MLTSSTAHVIAAALMAVYGLVTLAGGTIGYVKAGSLPSLVAGGVAGVLLLVCAYGVFRVPTYSLIGAIVVSLALLGRFAPPVLQNLRNLGEFLGKATGPVGVVMTAGGVLVIIAAVVALLSGRGGPPAAP